jgi:hypothetical protein
MLGYGVVSDLTDEYPRMSNNICLDSMYKFSKAVIATFIEVYLREPIIANNTWLLLINKVRGFLGMIGIIALEWENYPFSWQGQ